MGTLSHIIGDGLSLNSDASSGYLPINLKNVLFSFVTSLSASMECQEEK